ncbi:sugar transferase [Streptomyces sp. SID13666]|uniref:sugar transferase n=1 Tax=Streptomyces TaxID=1883 RepID=UPI001106D787|nr:MULTISPECIES: sugar transferase [Streptomyces]NEA58502.1 sugar transferase [Streptomyces sp. SID13666]NEA72510.1 sugar transferase [Streptomyces sp. SID13588]QNA74423.1 sugar transferase [Streptomyces sp. So13.3]
MTTESASAPHPARHVRQTKVAPATTAPISPPRGPSDAAVQRRPHARVAVRHRAVVPLVATDCLAAAGVLAVRPGSPVLLLGPLLVCLTLLHTYAGLYRTGLDPAALDELPALLGCSALAWCASATTLAAVRPAHSPGWPVLLTTIAATSLLACAARAVVYRFQRWSARRHPRSTLLVGAGPVVQQVADVLYAHPEYGMRPVGVVHPYNTPGTDSPLPVLGSVGDIHRAIIQNSVRYAVFAGPPAGNPAAANLVRLLAARGCCLWQVTSGPGSRTAGRPAAGHLWGFACARLDPYPRPGAGLIAKRVLDALLAFLALLPAAPILALSALAVRLSDGPGVLFRQERVGLDGRPFVLLKFRTLRPSDERESATRWNVSHDRRMSAVGHFLRRTSLDELPQLWNVLRGDMSLVGPRPERPYFVRQFSQTYPGYQERHRMPVGITGLAQIHGLRGDTSIEDRARFDNHYIESWSLWQDIRILLRTATALFRFGGS